MGSEAFWVPAVLAAAGAGTSYVNSQNANKRQQAGEVAAIGDQEKLQAKGRAGVNALTQQIASNTPDQIAGKATGDYVNVLRKNAAGTMNGSGNKSNVLFGAPTSSLPTTINANARYDTGNAVSQKEVSDYGNTEANEMGQIDAATRQRQNEGLAESSLGTNLNLLGAQSYTKNFVDQLRTQAAGVQSPWLTLLSGVLGNTAKTTAQNGTFAAKPPAGMTSQYSGGYQPTAGNGVDFVN